MTDAATMMVMVTMTTAASVLCGTGGRPMTMMVMYSMARWNGTKSSGVDSTICEVKMKGERRDA